jgi:hypothetical protein
MSLSAQARILLDPRLILLPEFTNAQQEKFRCSSLGVQPSRDSSCKCISLYLFLNYLIFLFKLLEYS